MNPDTKLKSFQVIKFIILTVELIIVAIFALNPNFRNFVIFFIVAVIFGIILNKKNPEIFDKDFFKTLLTIIISGLIISFGSSLYMLSVIGENQITNSKYNYYDFSVYPSSENWINFHNFQIVVDYKENKGNFTFSIYDYYLNNMSNLRINVPSGYNITKVELKNSTQNFIERKNYITGYGGTSEQKEWNVINIGEYKNIISHGFIDFSLYFDAINFTSPNGKYHLEVESKQVFTKSFDRKAIYIILGDYSCKNPCQGDTKDSIISIDNNVLSVSYPENYYDIYDKNSQAVKPLVQEFGLNMENKNIARDVDTNRQYGIGFIVSGIIILLQSLIEFYMVLFFGNAHQRKK